MDKLVKELYVENAHLVKCLEVTERQRKDSDQRIFALEDKCNALNRVLQMVCPAALT